MPIVELVERELSRSVIGAVYDVYNELGFGFLESIHATALERELLARGFVNSRITCVRRISSSACFFTLALSQSPAECTVLAVLRPNPRDPSDQHNPSSAMPD